MSRLQSQFVGASILRRDNAVLCPGCGKRSRVYKSVGCKRYRKCLYCHVRYITQEVHQSEVDRLLGMVDSALEILNEELNEQR